MTATLGVSTFSYFPYAVFNIVGPREIYDSVEWPVIVLLGSLIPLGTAFEEAGGTELIANA